MLRIFLDGIISAWYARYGSALAVSRAKMLFSHSAWQRQGRAADHPLLIYKCVSLQTYSAVPLQVAPQV